MKNQVQLTAYVDRFSGGGLRELHELLLESFNGAFGGVHLLPFFFPIDGADAGFDPIDHTRVDARLGTWDDVRALGEHVEIMADLIVNHVSSRSPQFLDYDERGDESRYAGMFLTYSKVFGDGARESELLQLYRPRPGLPFTRYQLKHGEERLVWTTFTGEQIDINVHHTEGKRYLDSILQQFHAAGIRAIRLDAAGYAVKKAATSCFMIPETFDFIGNLTAQAHALGIEVLVEIHSHYLEQIEIARQVDWVYDFALPPLVLHTLYTRNARQLKRWFEIRPRNAVTVLDTHDGIGVLDVGADRKGRNLPGLLTPDEIDVLVDTIHHRSRNESRQATGAAANNLDLYQINCTFYDALGRDDDAYLIARALQLFTPGIPQVYYVGLLAGRNDMELLRRTAVGRDINRHYYTSKELQQQLARPTVRTLMKLLRFRNTHPAFAGEFHLLSSADDHILLEWRNESHWARLETDLNKFSGAITCSPFEANPGITTVWNTTNEVAR